MDLGVDVWSLPLLTVLLLGEVVVHLRSIACLPWSYRILVYCSQLGRTNNERNMNERNKKINLFTNRKSVHERKTQIHVLSFVQVERFYRISFLSFVPVERFCRISFLSFVPVERFCRISFLSFVPVERFCRISLLSFIRSCFVRSFMFRSSREQF